MDEVELIFLEELKTIIRKKELEGIRITIEMCNIWEWAQKEDTDNKANYYITHPNNNIFLLVIMNTKIKKYQNFLDAWDKYYKEKYPGLKFTNSLYLNYFKTVDNLINKIKPSSYSNFQQALHNLLNSLKYCWKCQNYE